VGPPPWEDVFRQLVDFVVPSLPPYEVAVYLVLIRMSYLANGEAPVRIGKGRIIQALGKSAAASNRQRVTEKLVNLESAGFIQIGDTDRGGTQYVVKLPAQVPLVREQMAAFGAPDVDPRDHYTDPELRNEIFERDNWTCRYCGESVNRDTATLDHMVPVSLGGMGSPENLATACMMCNSTKSGRTYEEAAPQILARVVALRSQDSN